MQIGKVVLNDGTELEILEDSSEFALSMECCFSEIEEIAQKLTMKNLKRFGLSFAEGYIDYKTYKKVNSINMSPIDESKYKVLFILEDDNFLEIQTLEMQDYQMLNTSTVLATQILAQKFNDTEALTVKQIYPQWIEGTEYEIDYKVLSGDTLYKCLEKNTATNKNRPGIEETLWTNIEPKSDTIPPVEEPSETPPTEELPDNNGEGTAGDISGSGVTDGDQITE